MAEQEQVSAKNYPLPKVQTLQHLAKLSIVEDKPDWDTFPRRRKNLFHHLGLDTTLPSSARNNVIQTIISDISQVSQVYKKDLDKYLGIDHLYLVNSKEMKISETCPNNFKKDLSNYLGLDNKTLDRVKKTNQLNSVQRRSKETNPDSEGYSSIDSSSSSS